ncbi:hypothetical protein DW114_03015 [Absiella sp. AM09-50]|jgi:hypothetical protein|nr:hypothetical protein DW271_07870 [Absiella sp. AM22-9]RGB61877.1 hypothetical protein DW120_05915 [Absiella sp. AM10-20]RGB70300.1 hypothetical protein DW113_00795 [Absiella sp. AM09-45]RGB78766.1 hypothetical protein DW114_03015 [Absiella sp. AM09-50]RHU09512.1 hypothetical protein DW716_03475 [Absiella sp. AM27-20]
MKGMEGYIEVSFLFCFLTIYLSVKLACFSCLKMINKKQMLFYSAITAIHGCLFFDNAWICLIIWEWLCFLQIFKSRRKVYFMAYAIRILLFFSVFAWYHGSFHNGMYYLPIDEHMWMVWLLYAFLFFMLKRKWHTLLAQGNYVYPATLSFAEKKLHIKGYLDSGNLLRHKDLPVVFLDAKYASYFDEKNIELVVMDTIQKTGMMQCMKAQLYMEGAGTQLVYVSFAKTLHLPFDCEVLLNMNVMTLG